MGKCQKQKGLMMKFNALMNVKTCAGRLDDVVRRLQTCAYKTWAGRLDDEVRRLQTCADKTWAGRLDDVVRRLQACADNIGRLDDVVRHLQICFRYVLIQKGLRMKFNALE